MRFRIPIPAIRVEQILAIHEGNKYRIRHRSHLRPNSFNLIKGIRVAFRAGCIDMDALVQSIRGMSAVS